MITLTKTMKVIDLLVKIANGEQVPEFIKVFDVFYEYDYSNKMYLNSNNKTLFDIHNGRILNYDAKVFEDTPKDKKIEKIKFTNGGLTLHKVVDEIENDYPVGEVERTIIFKLNEIIDKINGGE